MDHYLRQRPVEGPFALTFSEKNAQRIYDLNEAAEWAGLTQGLSFADARALCPDLASDLADPVSDLRFLNMLARWAERYCPIVSTDGANGLLLDITGTAHLFGGEDDLVSDLLARLDRAGLSARLGMADTIGAAWAVARFACDAHKSYGRRQTGIIVDPGDSVSALANLPVMALRIDPQTSNSLRRLGLSTIHDLQQVPPATLARRFGSTLLTQMDLALGQAMEPVTPRRTEPRFAARITLPEPIGLADDVLGIAGKLMQQVCDRLEAAHKGARRLRLTAQRVDSDNQTTEIGLARPMRDPKRMTRLFAHAVEKMDAGFGIERMWLEAIETEPLNLTQQSHIDRKNRESEALADLLSRVGNRVGFENVQRYLPAESHIPEKSFVIAAAAYSEPAGDWPVSKRRPLMIFPPEPITGRDRMPPQHFRWRNMRFSIAHSEGPERIQPEWWLDDPDWRSGLRDYWRVQTHQGRRLWLFHTPKVSHLHVTTWFVQGEFA